MRNIEIETELFRMLGAPAIREALRSGRLVDDRVFDRIYPIDVRRASPVHWTPVEIAVRAAKLLADRPGVRLLDVGAGVGKFCIVASAVVNASVVGVEHRPTLARIAEDAANVIGVEVDFERGTLEGCNPRDYDGVYLFNPFAENLALAEDHIDESVELSEKRFWRDIDTMERFLRLAPVGMRVVTYCGWGGAMPPGYCLSLQEFRAGTLELWVKTCAAANVGPSMPRLGRITRAALRERALAERDTRDRGASSRARRGDG